MPVGSVVLQSLTPIHTHQREGAPTKPATGLSPHLCSRACRRSCTGSTRGCLIGQTGEQAPKMTDARWALSGRAQPVLPWNRPWHPNGAHPASRARRGALQTDAGFDQTSPSHPMCHLRDGARGTAEAKSNASQTLDRCRVPLDRRPRPATTLPPEPILGFCTASVECLAQRTGLCAQMRETTLPSIGFSAHKDGGARDALERLPPPEGTLGYGA